jgi:hypothetical protein
MEIPLQHYVVPSRALRMEEMLLSMATFLNRISFYPIRPAL